ncbi:MAG: hypothetical protein A2283_16975 [Lentisphaerae bacterium RIFOXYA12_FULL_48_11]|nr:MAG: hypothetical protein A2283_16975 [Lentisphaerae bacterium RIFOXYA12_FULL_48_11]
MWRRLFIRLNNRITALRKVRVPAGNILLILPHCLHNSSCRQDVLRSLDECKLCGQCSLAGIVRTRNDFGVITSIAGGGSQAVIQTRREDVKAVVAVACEKELFQGILEAFPKPVIAILNETPEGPCRNTNVDINKVISAIQSLLDCSRPWPGH